VLLTQNLSEHVYSNLNETQGHWELRWNWFSTRIFWYSSRKLETSYNTCPTKVAPLKANPLTKLGYHIYKATKTFRAWTHRCRFSSSLLDIHLLDLLSASRRVDQTFAGVTIRIVDLGGWFPGCYYLLRKQYSSQWKVFLSNPNPYYQHSKHFISFHPVCSHIPSSLALGHHTKISIWKTLIEREREREGEKENIQQRLTPP
jgi:hypothetical protein